MQAAREDGALVWMGWAISRGDDKGRVRVRVALCDDGVLLSCTQIRSLRGAHLDEVGDE